MNIQVISHFPKTEILKTKIIKMKNSSTLLLIFLFIISTGNSQNINCCDSLMKLAKSKTIKSSQKTKFKSVTKQNPDINITIDNSHSANNNLPKEENCCDEKTKSNRKKVASKDDGSKWSEYFKPSIDLLIALISAIVLIWKYLNQKQKELKEKIIKSKRDAYSKFLEDFTERAVKIMHDKDVDNIKQDRERMLARNQLLLYANDKVIQAYHNWIEYADKEDHDINREVDLFGKVLVEIRKDIHGKSDVTEFEISNLNPFNRG